MSVRGLDGRDGERNVEQRAIFTATEAFDDSGFFVPAIAGDDQGNVFSDGFLCGIAEDAFGAVVPAGDDAFKSFADNGVIGGVDNRGEQGGAAFGAPALGDFAGDLGGANHAALGIFDRGDGERNVDERTVFALAYGVEVLNALAAKDAGDNVVLLRVAVFGDDEGDVAADGFFGAIAEDSLGGFVPTGDHAIERDADDDVVGRVDDGGEKIAGLIVGAAVETLGRHVATVIVAIFEGAFDDGEEITGEVGLAAVGASADFGGLVGDDFGIVLADEDDVELGNLAAEDAGGIEAVHTRHANVHQDDVGMCGASLVDGLLAVGGFAADLPIGMAGEHPRDDVPDAGI